jgi:capsular exopolysaccharide synthesis family protein
MINRDVFDARVGIRGVRNNMMLDQKMSSTPNTISQAVKQDDEIDLMALIGTLWRGKWWIALCAFVGLISGGLYAKKVAVPIYSSSTVIVIEQNEPSLIDIQSVVGGMSNESEALSTEIEVIRSRFLMEKIIAKLDLLTDPEFNPTLTEPPFLSLANLLSLSAAQPRLWTDQELLNAAVERLRARTSVSVLRGTYAITVAVTSEGKQKSELIANTIAEMYREEQLRVKFITLDEGVTWLSERVVELEHEIQEKDAALQQAAAEADYINVEGLELMNRQVRDLRERLIGEKNDAENAAAVYTQLSSAITSKDIALVLAAANDLSLRRLSEGKSGEELWAEGAPFAIRLATLVTRARNDRERAETQVASLASTIASVEVRVDDQAKKLSNIQQMTRDLDTVSVLYETFLTRLKETTIQKGFQSPDARVLSRAIAGKKVAPRTAMIAALCLIFGAFFGSAIILLRELKADTFRNSEELQATTGEQVIGQIPLLPLKARKDLLQYLQDKPTSAAVEAVRNLRTSLLLSKKNEAPPQVIMSTSTIPGEGKTTQSISLAHNLSGLGKKVLLIEGDIRRRTLDEYFKQEASKHGVLSVVAGDVPLADAVMKSDRLKADVLMGQKSKVNAADVFASDEFKNFLSDTRKAYDYIIIDTPPVLVVPDARLIGQLCDAVMFTVKWDSTTKSQVKAALKELHGVNLTVSGLVLSQINAKGMKRYGYGDTHGAYGDYGGGYYDE